MASGDGGRVGRLGLTDPTRTQAQGGHDEAADPAAALADTAEGRLPSVATLALPVPVDAGGDVVDVDIAEERAEDGIGTDDLPDTV
jgi:hypothetical protein